jgi:hypothetical protein
MRGHETFPDGLQVRSEKESIMRAKHTVRCFAVCAAWVTAGAGARQWEVLDFGAVADARTDNTTAFQQALDAAGAAGGGTVFAPTGEYRFDSHLVIPYAVELKGSYNQPVTHHQSEPPLGFSGTTFLVYGGRGRREEPAFIELDGKMSALRGVCIRYPEAAYDQVPPAPYPPTVLMQQWETTVENVCVMNAYEGIRIREGGRHLVRNVHGYPTFRGMTVDWVQDVGRIENVHFSPMGFEFEPDGAYMRWVFAHGVAFDFAQTDWQYVLNTFCFGYSVGYRFRESRMGRTNGNFLGIAADCCRRPLLVEQCSEAGLLITNGQFVGQWGIGDSIGLEILEGCTGLVQLTNCSFFGPFDRLIKVSAPEARLSASACNFQSWDNDGDDSEAVEIEAGRAIVQGSFFRQAKLHVVAGPEARAVTLVGNQAPAGLRVRNAIGARLHSSANEQNTMVWPENGRLHYRIDIGSVGDIDYLERWGSAGNAHEWQATPEGTRRWCRPGSRLVLPVVPGREYVLEMDLLVPDEAVHPDNGVYLGDERLAAFSEPGVQTVTGRVPPQTGDRVVLTMGGDGLPPADPKPLFRLLAPVRSVTLRAEGIADGGRLCDANTGDWLPHR